MNSSETLSVFTGQLRCVKYYISDMVVVCYYLRSLRNETTKETDKQTNTNEQTKQETSQDVKIEKNIFI